MAVQPTLEFVCYQEGGVIDVTTAVDGLLEPTLDQLLAFQPPEELVFESDEPEVAAQPLFKPGLRPLKLHRGQDDLLPPSVFRKDPWLAFPLNPEWVETQKKNQEVDPVFPFLRSPGATVPAPVLTPLAGLAAARSIETTRQATTSALDLTPAPSTPANEASETAIRRRRIPEPIMQRPSALATSKPLPHIRNSVDVNFHNLLTHRPARPGSRPGPQRRDQKFSSLIRKYLLDSTLYGGLGATAAGLSAVATGFQLADVVPVVSVGAGLAFVSLLTRVIARPRTRTFAPPLPTPA